MCILLLVDVASSLIYTLMMDFRISHIIDCMAGVPAETARSRISSYAQDGLICIRKAGANTSPNLYSAKDAAVAIVLSALQDLGVADLSIMGDAKIGLYAEMDRCLEGLAHGEPCTFVVNVFRTSIGCAAEARLVQPGDAAGSDIRLPQRGSIVVVLDDLLLPLVAYMQREKAN